MPERQRVPWFRWSTSVGLSLRYAALYTVLSAVVFYLALGLAKSELAEESQEQLSETIANLEAEFASGGIDAVIGSLRALELLNFENTTLSLLTDSQGNKVAGNIAGLDWNGTDTFLPIPRIDFGFDYEIEATGYSVAETNLGEHRLILGFSDQLQKEILESLWSTLVIGFSLVALAGAAAGVFVGRRTEQQVRRISTALGLVSQGDVGLRIPVDTNLSSDLARLSEDINNTLDELQKLLEAQRQISTDIAHDLKTPLQRLRQRIEVLATDTKLSPQTAAGVDAALDTLDDVMATFQALLRISEIETNNRRRHFAPTDLRRVLQRVEDAYGPVAEENNQSLIFARTGDPVIISGDSELLTQLVVNAVENALRHCPEGTTVTVGLRRDGAQVTLRICDDGPGIPPHEIEKVFDRFYRVDKSRSSSGNGLGLSLIKAVAGLHNTTVRLRSNNPGLCLEIPFTCADAAEPFATKSQTV